MQRLACTLIVAACSFEARIPATGVDADVDADGIVADSDIDGAPDSDRDDDGVPDATDNCPDHANENQADEDTDLVGNLCDNCPHVSNPTQANVLETDAGQTADGVGDACDPLPAASGQEIALFMPFDAASEITGWQSAGTNAQFSVTGGRLSQTGATDLAILWRNNLGFADAWITTEVTYLSIDNARQFRGAAVMTRFVRDSGSFGFGVGCGEMSDSVFMSGAPFFNLMRFDNGGFQNTSHGTGAVIAANHTATYTVHRTSGNTHACEVSPSTTYSGSLGLAEGDGTGINLAVWGATVSFRYLVVID